MPTITLSDVELIRGLSPKRCRFADHPIVHERSGADGYVVSTKFESISRLFELETGFSTSDGPYGPYCFLGNEHDISVALQWQEKHQNLIFLRDTLSCSIAMDFNLASAGVYTPMGSAERKAKLSKDEDAIEALVEACESVIINVPFYNSCELLCAVPPSPDKPWDLPTTIARRLSARLGKRDVSGMVEFTNAKKSVKSLSLEDKWAALEDGRLEVNGDVRRATIILIDDKYQSGTTAQFVASKLYNAGAAKVCGLFCVKTWRDTDNTV